MVGLAPEAARFFKALLVLVLYGLAMAVFVSAFGGLRQRRDTPNGLTTELFTGECVPERGRGDTIEFDL